MSSLLPALLSSGRKILTVSESKEVLTKYGLPFNKSVFVSVADDIPVLCKDLLFPVVMKIVSPQIIHKTDVGGVILHLSSLDEVISAFTNLMASLKVKFPSYDLQGVLIEEEIPEGLELIAGVVNDPTFGHCLMFGIGGIFVEALNDVSFRLIPASRSDIESMVSELRFSKLLSGLRGNSVNLDQLYVILAKLSSFSAEYADQISEIDLNPIIATQNQLVIVDARIILKE